MMLPKGVFCSSTGVFSEVVRSELGGMSNERSVLWGVVSSWPKEEGLTGGVGEGAGGI